MFQMFKRLKKRDVLAALNEINDPNIDPFANWGHLRDLCEKDSAVFTESVLDVFESEDDLLRAHAARAMGLTSIKELPVAQEAFIAHLKTDSSAIVRGRCVFGLVSLDMEKPHPPQVIEAFIHASKDEDEKVAFFSCCQLGHLAGPEAIAALFEALWHPIWGVRLEACKQLILLKKVDADVIATLEALLEDPKAQEYDDSMDESARLEKKIREEIREQYPQLVDELKEEKGWGKMSEILEKAREVAY